MSMLNCICPECGKKFHACYNCGLVHDYEYEYCSEICYKKSLKYEEKKNKIIKLILDAKRDIYKLDELSYYLQEEIDDEVGIFLSDEEIKECWYRRD